MSTENNFESLSFEDLEFEQYDFENTELQDEEEIQNKSQKKLSIKIGASSAKPSPSAVSTNIQSRKKDASKFSIPTKSIKKAVTKKTTSKTSTKPIFENPITSSKEDIDNTINIINTEEYETYNENELDNFINEQDYLTDLNETIDDDNFDDFNIFDNIEDTADGNIDDFEVVDDFNDTDDFNFKDIDEIDNIFNDTQFDSLFNDIETDSKYNEDDLNTEYNDDNNEAEDDYDHNNVDEYDDNKIDDEYEIYDADIYDVINDEIFNDDYTADNNTEIKTTTDIDDEEINTDEDNLDWINDVFIDSNLIHNSMIQEQIEEEDEYEGLEFATYDTYDFPTETPQIDLSNIEANDNENTQVNEFDKELENIFATNTIVQQPELVNTISSDNTVENKTEQSENKEFVELFDYDKELIFATTARDEQIKKDAQYSKNPSVPKELFAMANLDLSEFPELAEKNKAILQELSAAEQQDRLSEIAYAYTTNEQDLPNFIPPMEENSLKFKELDEVKEILGVCICGEISYGIYTSSQQEFSQQALFDEQSLEKELQWSPDALKAVPIKALFGCYDEEIKKVIAVSPTFLSPEEIVSVKKLIMEGATLLINTLSSYDFGEEPMYSSFDEMNLAVCQSENFQYQAKLYALEKILKDNGLNVQLVTKAILSLAEESFYEECCQMLKDVCDIEKTEKRDILLNDSNEVRLALPQYANDTEDDNFMSAKGLIEVAAKLLENDNLSHSNYCSDRFVGMVSDLLSLNKFKSYFESIENKIPLNILFSDL